MSWKPVSTKGLPKKDGRFLCTTIEDNRRRVEVKYFDVGYGDYWHNVVAYQEFPQPYVSLEELL